MRCDLRDILFVTLLGFGLVLCEDGGSCSADKDGERDCSKEDHAKTKWTGGAGESLELAAAAVRSHYNTFPNPTFSTADLKEEEVYYEDPKKRENPMYVSDFLTLDILNHYLYKGREDFSNGFRVLVAGGGTGFSVLYLAEQLNHTNAEVVYLDCSEVSLDIARQRAEKRKLSNIVFIHDTIENIPSIKNKLGKFQFIEARHVLEHLADPEAGLRILASILTEDGGISLSLHADIGRTGLMQMQELMKLVNKRATSREERISNTRLTLGVLPPTNWYKRYQTIGVQFKYLTSNSDPKVVEDSKLSDSDLAELFLHPLDRTYRIPAVYGLVSNVSLNLVTFPDYADRLTLKVDRHLKDVNFARQVLAKPAAKHQAVAEIMSGVMTKHEVLLSSNTNTEADFNHLDNVPFFYGNPQDLPDFPSRLPSDGFFYGRVGYRKSGMKVDKRIRDFRWPVSENIFHFISIVGRGEGKTTREVMQEVIAETGVMEPNEEEVLQDLRRFYTACKESGLMLLRAKSISPFPKTANLKLYKIKPQKQ